MQRQSTEGWADACPIQKVACQHERWCQMVLPVPRSEGGCQAKQAGVWRQGANGDITPFHGYRRQEDDEIRILLCGMCLQSRRSRTTCHQLLPRRTGPALRRWNGRPAQSLVLLYAWIRIHLPVSRRRGSRNETQVTGNTQEAQQSAAYAVWLYSTVVDIQGDGEIRQSTGMPEIGKKPDRRQRGKGGDWLPDSWCVFQYGQTGRSKAIHQQSTGPHRQFQRELYTQHRGDDIRSLRRPGKGSPLLFPEYCQWHDIRQAVCIQILR